MGYIIIILLINKLLVIYHVVALIIRIEYFRWLKYPIRMHMPLCRLLGTSLVEVIMIIYYYLPRLQAYVVVYSFCKHGSTIGLFNIQLLKFILIRIISYLTGIPYILYVTVMECLRFFKNNKVIDLPNYIRCKYLNRYREIYNNESSIIISYGEITINTQWMKKLTSRYGYDINNEKNFDTFCEWFTSYKGMGLSISQEVSMTPNGKLREHTCGSVNGSSLLSIITHQNTAAGTRVYSSGDMRRGTNIFLGIFEDGSNLNSNNTLSPENSYLIKQEIYKSRVFFATCMEDNEKISLLVNSKDKPLKIYEVRVDDVLDKKATAEFLKYENDIALLKSIGFPKDKIAEVIIHRSQYLAALSDKHIDIINHVD